MVWSTLRVWDIWHVVRGLQSLYNLICIAGSKSDLFLIGGRFRQGCPVTTCVYNYYGQHIGVVGVSTLATSGFHLCFLPGQGQITTPGRTTWLATTLPNVFESSCELGVKSSKTVESREGYNKLREDADYFTVTWSEEIDWFIIKWRRGRCQIEPL